MCYCCIKPFIYVVLFFSTWKIRCYLKMRNFAQNSRWKIEFSSIKSPQNFDHLFLKAYLRKAPESKCSQTLIIFVGSVIESSLFSTRKIRFFFNKMMKFMQKIKDIFLRFGADNLCSVVHFYLSEKCVRITKIEFLDTTIEFETLFRI